MEAWRKELMEKKEELLHLQQLNQVLIEKDRKKTHELSLVRKELLNVLRGAPNGGTEIGIKRLGELDPKPFIIACRRKYPAVKDEVNAMELFTLWDDLLRNSEWTPFKLVIVAGETNEVIDEDDELLLELKLKWGPEVYDAVTTALLELNQYNPSGRFMVEELWHFKEKRRATFGEVIQFISNNGSFASASGEQTVQAILAKKQVLDQMIQLEKQLEAKQKLELDIELLKGSLHKIEALKNELNKKESEMESLDELNVTLLMKESKITDEIQNVRKELIAGLKDMFTGPARIGVKRMGELDLKPFKIACRRKFPTAEADNNAMQLCSFWDDRLRNPEWHPFKIVKDEGKTDEIIDEDDEQLQELKNQWGDEVLNAVTTTLLELNEYNASGRYIVEELWHFQDKRKATLKEVIQHIFKKLKFHKRKR